MFDSLFTVFVATAVIVIFSTVTDHFTGAGFLVRVLLAARWNGILIVLSSGWSSSFTGSLPRYGHTASLLSCLRL